MKVDIAGMTVTLDPARANVRVELPGGGHMDKMGVEVVLLFGILLALTKGAKTK